MPPRHVRSPSEGGEVVVRSASTVMMVRDGDHDESPLEVLMVRRNVRSDFVGGAHVFPGGALDPEDGGAEAEALCTGRTDVAASALLGLPEGGLAYWVAALRECFEEAGLLLAERDHSQLLSLADPADARRFSRYRVDLNAGRRSFLEVCRDEGLRLPLDRVHYFSHWITPVGAVRRYDTRFFVAAAPPGQVPAHDAGETIADIWLRPADALAQHRAGAIELIFPTVRTLQAIGRFATAAELLAAAEVAGPALAGRTPLLPRMVRDANGTRLLLPGDPGYDEAGAAPVLEGRSHDAAAREASRAANQGPPAPGPAAVPDAGVGPLPTPGRADELRPGLVRLTAPNPGMMTGPGTNTYLVGTAGDLAVVDPGPDDEGHLRAIEAEAARRGRIRWVLTTHTHPDHAPGAAPLARRTGAELVGFEARDGFVPDVTAGDGWVLEGPTFRLRAVHTPGHAGNHLCWLFEEEGVLLSGDHVMHGATVVIRPPDGDMAAYLASLRRLLDGDPPIAAIAPGHGRLIGDPGPVLEGIVAHRLGREAVVAEAVETTGGGTVDELLRRVYADVAPALLPVARWSLWAHLRKLAAEGRVVAVPVPLAPAAVPVPSPPAAEGGPAVVAPDLPPGTPAAVELSWRWEPASRA